MDTKKGSFGTVYIDKLARKVTKVQTLKDKDNILNLSTMGDAGISSFVASLASLASLGYNYFPRLNDISIQGKNLEIDMMYHGETLVQWYSSTPVETRIKYSPTLIYQLADACDYLLANDLQHTDIKPANVLIADTEEGPKLTLIDYNIYSVNTLNGWVNSVGTWCYTAPEILFREAPHKNSMSWSLGMILAEVCCGYAMGSIELQALDINDRQEWKRIMRRKQKKYTVHLPLSHKHLCHMPADLVSLFKWCTRWNMRDRPSLQDIKHKLKACFPDISVNDKPVHNLVLTNEVHPSTSSKRNEILEKIAEVCKGDLHTILYRSIWLFDAYNHDDIVSIAACITLAYAIYGYTPDDGYMKLITKHIGPCTLDDIEDAMVKISTKLDWMLYDKGADMLALYYGVNKHDIVSNIVGILQTQTKPYDSIAIAKALYKATVSNEDKRLDTHVADASVTRNKQTSDLCFNASKSMGDDEATFVENTRST